MNADTQQPQELRPVEVGQELHICPSCQYTQGFHVSFIRRGGTPTLRLILLCPNCDARFDIGKTI